MMANDFPVMHRYTVPTAFVVDARDVDDLVEALSAHHTLDLPDDGKPTVVAPDDAITFVENASAFASYADDFRYWFNESERQGRDWRLVIVPIVWDERTDDWFDAELLGDVSSRAAVFGCCPGNVG